MAGHARRADSGELRLDGLLAAPDGSALVRCGSCGPPEDAAALGREVAELVLAGGGRELLDGSRRATVSPTATGGSGETGETGETSRKGRKGEPRPGPEGGPPSGPEGGIVYLVGAGPGDPGLLTLRGAEVLKRADVVVHDRLTAASLLSLAPPASEKVDVGKQPDDRGDQEAINALLIERAKAGLEVVRLKGGDPFVFGRGGEEALALIEAGVAFEVVPGVTSAVAAPAYAGVPVTHRGLVTAFTVVAGHTRSVDREPADGGTELGSPGRRRRDDRRLDGGRAPGQDRRTPDGRRASPGTPVAAVQWGTSPGQVTVRTTLGRLGAAPLAPPVTIVIGEVAGLNLSWYEDRPLFGQTVVVTRSAHQAPDLSHPLGAPRGPGRRSPRHRPGPTLRWWSSTEGRCLQAERREVFVGRLHLRQCSAPVLRARPRHPLARRGAGGGRRTGHRRGLAGLSCRGRPRPRRLPERGPPRGLPAPRPHFSLRPAPRLAIRLPLPPPAVGPPPPGRRRPARAARWAGAAQAGKSTPSRPTGRCHNRSVGTCWSKQDGPPPSASPPHQPSTATSTRPAPPVPARRPSSPALAPLTAATARARGLKVSAEASEHTLDGLVAALAPGRC